MNPHFPVHVVAQREAQAERNNNAGGGDRKRGVAIVIQVAEVNSSPIRNISRTRPSWLMILKMEPTDGLNTVLNSPGKMPPNSDGPRIRPGGDFATNLRLADFAEQSSGDARGGDDDD